MISSALRELCGLLHGVQRHVNGIEQRRPAFGLRKGQLILNLFRAAREAQRQFRPVVELHQERFVFRDSWS